MDEIEQSHTILDETGVPRLDNGKELTLPDRVKLLVKVNSFDDTDLIIVNGVIALRFKNNHMLPTGEMVAVMSADVAKALARELPNAADIAVHLSPIGSAMIQ